MSENKNKPTKSYRLGNVEASVWPNKSPKDGSIYFSFNFQKSFKNKDGDWVQTGFFNRGDLADLAILAQKILYEEITPINKRKTSFGNNQTEESAAEYSCDDEVPF